MELNDHNGNRTGINDNYNVGNASCVKVNKEENDGSARNIDNNEDEDEDQNIKTSKKQEEPIIKRADTLTMKRTNPRVIKAMMTRRMS